MLWSFGPLEGGTDEVGVGVEARFGCPDSAERPAAQGLIESTADDRYDFSAFFSGA